MGKRVGLVLVVAFVSVVGLMGGAYGMVHSPAAPVVCAALGVTQACVQIVMAQLELEMQAMEDVPAAAPVPVASADIRAEWVRMCTQWRADAIYRREVNSPRPAQQQVTRDIEHIIATRCVPRGL